MVMNRIPRNRPKSSGLKWVIPSAALIFAMVLLAFSASPVYAEGEAPTAPETPETVENDNEQEPVVEPTPEVTDLLENGSEQPEEPQPVADGQDGTLVETPNDTPPVEEENEEGQPQPTPEAVVNPVSVEEESAEDQSQSTPEAVVDPVPSIETIVDGSNAPSIQDPYFTRASTLFQFTAADCDPYTDGEQPCATPIQAALDDIALNGVPDDRIVNIEGGTYAENITIDGLDSDLILWGGADSNPTILSGSILISNTGTTTTRTITLRNLTLSNNTVTASCASCTTAGLSLVLDEVVLDGTAINVTGTDNDDTVVINVNGITNTSGGAITGGAGDDSFTIRGTTGDDQITSGHDWRRSDNRF